MLYQLFASAAILFTVLSMIAGEQKNPVFLPGALLAGICLAGALYFWKTEICAPTRPQ